MTLKEQEIAKMKEQDILKLTDFAQSKNWWSYGKKVANNFAWFDLENDLDNRSLRISRHNISKNCELYNRLYKELKYKNTHAFTIFLLDYSLIQVIVNKFPDFLDKYDFVMCGSIQSAERKELFSEVTINKAYLQEHKNAYDQALSKGSILFTIDSVKNEIIPF